MQLVCGAMASHNRIPHYKQLILSHVVLSQRKMHPQ